MKDPFLTTDILILGAGIGGYETFRTLAGLLRREGLPQKITIVDRNNYFTFTPMLHEVASGAIEPSHCTVPLRELVYKTPHTFLKATVQAIVPDEKTVRTDSGTIRYSYLVIALGSGVNYFGTPGAAEFSYSVRTLPAAMKLRQDLIAGFESTAGLLAVTIVGGGYTGIETAGQLAYLAKHDLKKLYPNVTPAIRVVEAGQAILANLPLQAQEKIKKRLEKQGVACSVGRAVKSVSKKTIVFNDGETVASDFTIWCAGVKNIADQFLPGSHQSKGRIVVNEFLQVPTDNAVYAVGDMAQFTNPGSERPAPQLAKPPTTKDGMLRGI